MIANADKRYQNFRDYFNNITQAIKFSYDNGRTWTNPREILKVQIPSLKNQGFNDRWNYDRSRIFRKCFK
ncbi:glycoside hydrolase [Mycoplasmopsis cynos]|uniref:sialidase family protein n=1 Tax=Mycoplasmopsis cynos TaxID=171284 RepID=UPI0024C61717|nr:sialidase family protein [Mycoplasmopsis cynos]WAM09758.1 glycoside hydrolase [Mycoplasmopsis cynos]